MNESEAFQINISKNLHSQPKPTLQVVFKPQRKRAFFSTLKGNSYLLLIQFLHFN